MTPSEMLRAENARDRKEAREIIYANPKEELVASLAVLYDFSEELQTAPCDYLAISNRLLPRLIELAESL